MAKVESAEDFAYKMSCLVYTGTNLMGDEFADFDMTEATTLIAERDKLLIQKALEDSKHE